MAAGLMTGPEPDRGPFSVIVLAGGRAERLGRRDKPALVVGARSLLDTVIAAGRDAGAEPIVVVGPERPVTAAKGPGGDPGVRFVREDPPGSGPIPALRRGLTELPGEPGLPEWVAILAADLPFLKARHLSALRDAIAPRDAGAVLADDGGRAQWLAGCWRAVPLHAAIAGYTGASLRGLMAPLDPVPVTFRPGPGEPPPWLDCDTEDDLRRAREWRPA